MSIPAHLFGSLRHRVLIALLLLLAPNLAADFEHPTQVVVRSPVGTNNVNGAFTATCTGAAGSNLTCSPDPGEITDDLYLESMTFDGVTFAVENGFVAAGVASVITVGSGVNAEYGDDDDANDGDADPFTKSGNPGANQESEVPSIRDPAVAESLGGASISEGVDGEGDDFLLRLDMEAVFRDNDAAADEVPEMIILERGINSDTGIQLIFLDGMGMEQTTNQLNVLRTDHVDMDIDIDTLEIGGPQALGIVGIDASEFSGSGYDPVNSDVIGVLFSSTGGGADHFGIFATSTGFARDFGDAPDGGSGTSGGDYRTRVADGGPLHLIPSTPTTYLGSVAPDEDDGTAQNAAADADDTDGGGDDEEGLTIGGSTLSDQSLTQTATHQLDVEITGPGYINVFIDWNGDGDFDDTVDSLSEHVVDDDDQSAGSGTRTINYNVEVPLNAAIGTTYVRARVCTDPNDCDTAGGAAGAGEVEDYRVFVVPPFGACYVAHIDGVVSPSDSAVWSFDNTLLDVTGNGHGPQNAPTEVYDADNALGEGQSFDVPATGVQYSDGTFLDLDFSQATLGFWFKADSVPPGSDQVLFEEGNSTDGYSVVLTSGGDIRVEIREGGAGSNLQVAGIDAVNGQWHHVAFTYDSGVARAYIDGRLRGELSTGFGSLPSSGDGAGFGAQFGTTASSTAVSSFDGLLDEAFVFRGAVLPTSNINSYVNCVSPIGFVADFGDAPDDEVFTALGDYSTVFANGGPYHLLGGGLHIDTTEPDADSGVLRNAEATADDTDGTADEGDVTFDELLIITDTYEIDVTVTNEGGAATLYGWIDFDRSGTFDFDEVETIAVPATVADSVVTLTFDAIPADIASGTSYVRLRLTREALTTAASGEDEDTRSLGSAYDGEVEDYAILIDDTVFDFGDAPDTYLTLEASGGPSHGLDPNLVIGFSTDAETDGFPYAGTTTPGPAEGDDDDGGDDEDGADNLASLASTATLYDADVRVTNNTGQTATLVGWIDFDIDGVFQADEGVTVSVPDETDGTVTLMWTGIGTTIDIADGLTYARFRLTTDAITTSDVGGVASDGEVEDHDVTIFGVTQCEIDNGQLIPIGQFQFRISQAVVESGGGTFSAPPDDPPLTNGSGQPCGPTDNDASCNSTRVMDNPPVGTVVRYPEVVPGVDGLIEYRAAVNASVRALDSNDAGGFDQAFQPEVTLANPTPQNGGYVEFEIRFVKSGTSDRVEPAPTFLASAIDVDGSPGSQTFESVQFLQAVRHRLPVR